MRVSQNIIPSYIGGYGNQEIVFWLSLQPSLS